MAEFTQLEIINGTGLLLIVILFLYIALKLLSKYLSYKDKNLALLACAFLFMSLTWLAPTLFFLSLLLTDTPISLELYLLIGHAFNLDSFFLIILISSLMFKDKRKLIQTSVVIYYSVMVIIFFYLFFTNISLIASMEGFLKFQQGPFLLIRNLIVMILMIIFTVMFYRESHRSDNPQVGLRGTLFLTGMVMIIIGGISHMITGLAFVVFAFLAISSICFYTAFLTPEWMKKRLIKETE